MRVILWATDTGLRSPRTAEATVLSMFPDCAATTPPIGSGSRRRAAADEPLAGRPLDGLAEHDFERQPPDRAIPFLVGRRRDTLIEGRSSGNQRHTSSRDLLGGAFSMIELTAWTPSSLVNSARRCNPSRSARSATCAT